MNTTIRSIFVQVAYGMMLSMFSSCSLFDQKHDCPGVITTTDSLSASDKSTIPYSGYDSIKFVLLPVGTHHTFYGLGKINELNTTYYNDDVDCPNNIYKCEYESFKFQSSTAPKDPIYLLLYNECPKGGTATKLNFRGKTFLFGPYYVNGPISKDSISIQGVTYKEVYDIGEQSDRGDTSTYLLYNKKNGILKLKITDYEIWEKIN